MRRLTPQLRARGRRGFTLIEAAMATVIVGVGVLAVMGLMASGTAANSQSTERTTAIHLANSIREACKRVPFTSTIEPDLFDLEATYDPPVDARLQPVAAMAGWSQVVLVQSVDPNRITLVVPDNQALRTARVTVTIRRGGKHVYTLHWLVTNGT